MSPPSTSPVVKRELEPSVSPLSRVHAELQANREALKVTRQAEPQMNVKEEEMSDIEAEALLSAAAAACDPDTDSEDESSQPQSNGDIKANESIAQPTNLEEMPASALTPAPFGLITSEDDYIDDEVDHWNGRFTESVRLNDIESWTQRKCDASFAAGERKRFECLIHLFNQPRCDTHQEYYWVGETSRRVISSIFGHNKNEWEQIPGSVRVYLCRKHYQKFLHLYEKSTQNPSALAKIRLTLSRAQVEKIEQWRPNPRFKIQLTKAMHTRLSKFYELTHNGLSEHEAASQVDAVRKTGVSSKQEQKTPVFFAIAIDERFRGVEKNADDVRALFDWLESKLDDGTIKYLPAVEVLLECRSQDRDEVRARKVRRQAAVESRLLPGALALRKSVNARRARSGHPATNESVEREDSAVAGPSLKRYPEGTSVSFTPINDHDVPSMQAAPPANPETMATRTEEEMDTSGFKFINNTPASLGPSGVRRRGFRIKHSAGKDKGKTPIGFSPSAQAAESSSVEKRKMMDSPMASDIEIKELPRPAKRCKKQQDPSEDHRYTNRMTIDHVLISDDEENIVKIGKDVGGSNSGGPLDGSEIQDTDDRFSRLSFSNIETQSTNPVE